MDTQISVFGVMQYEKNLQFSYMYYGCQQTYSEYGTYGHSSGWTTVGNSQPLWASVYFPVKWTNTLLFYIKSSS